jgi:hypothetical protein
MRLRCRFLAILALALLAFLSVETAAASAHAHAAEGGCAPCRLLGMSSGLELPAAAALPAPGSTPREIVVAFSVETLRPAPPAHGRAPPAA